MDNKKTGMLITQRRQELGLTQKELGERLHVSDRAVSKWERAAGFPDVSLLEPLADALELSVLELIHGERLTTEEQPSPEAERSVRTAVRELISIGGQDADSVSVEVFYNVIVVSYVQENRRCILEVFYGGSICKTSCAYKYGTRGIEVDGFVASNENNERFTISWEEWVPSTALSNLPEGR